MVADGLEDYRDENADAILAAAQRRTGVSLSDADLRDQYITLIRQVVAPAAVTRATRKALAATGAPVRLWGNGWATRNDEPNVADPEPVPCGTDLTDSLPIRSNGRLPRSSDGTRTNMAGGTCQRCAGHLPRQCPPHAAIAPHPRSPHRRDTELPNDQVASGLRGCACGRNAHNRRNNMPAPRCRYAAKKCHRLARSTGRLRPGSLTNHDLRAKVPPSRARPAAPSRLLTPCFTHRRGG